MNHIDNRLYMLNILPCLESYVKEWLDQNSLIVHRIIGASQKLDLRSILNTFITNKKLKAEVGQLVDKMLINKHLLSK